MGADRGVDRGPLDVAQRARRVDADRVVVLTPEPEESQRDQVLAAVRYCPAMALSLEED